MSINISNRRIIMTPALASGVVPYAGPGDSQTFVLWGSVARGYSAAYAAPGNNPAFTVVDSSGANSQVINVLTTGLTDTATLATWIGAHGTASVTKLWDQVGSNHWNQATVSKMPTITTSAINGLPAMTFASASAQILAGTSSINQAQPVTLQAVAKRTANFTTFQEIIASTSNELDMAFSTVADKVGLIGNVVLNSNGTDAADTFFHVLQGVYNSTSSTINVDNTTQVTGTTGSAYNATGTVSLGGFITSLYLDGMIAEAGAYAGTESAGVQSNARTAYGL